MKLNREILEKIEQTEGSSFYIADLEQFRKNYYKLLNTYRKYYSNTYIAYSYKTNYLPSFCKTIKEEGGFAEVVSGMEMKLALKIENNYNQIFFNGPVKEIKYVEELLLNGGIVNIDSLEELKKIVTIAQKNRNKRLKIGMRLNFDVKDGVISRFGFDTNEEDFEDAIKIIDDIDNLSLVSLHCHFATRYLETWKNRTIGMLEIIENYFKNRLKDIKYISLGGGLYGEMNEEMKKQFEKYIPSFEDYAQVSAKLFNDYFKEKDNKPFLIIEPGTALAANSMKYVTKVESIKKVREKYIATLFGSTYNINPKANRKKVPLEIYSNGNQKYYENIDFAGYTCIESDYLYKGFRGNLAVGDFVVFNEVGTYSIVMKPPFIMPQVSIVEIKYDNYNILKRKETFEDIFITYRI
jgi:diaminopimelate decarboxylase